MQGDGLGTLWDALRLSLQFLTRVPVPAPWSAQAMARAPCWFAASGGLVGGTTALVYLLLSPVFGLGVGALFAIGAGVWLTGALHEDGLADTADGLGGGRTPERALEIMRDSRIGAYGAIALVFALLVQVALLMRLGPGLGAAGLIAGHVGSRASMAIALTTGRYLRAEGAGRGLAAPLGSLGWTILLASLALGMMALPPTAIPAALAGLAIAHVWLRRLYGRRLGGVTGDCLGAQQQVGHLGVLLGLAAWHGA